MAAGANDFGDKANWVSPVLSREALMLERSDDEKWAVEN
jgi:hypothetical protein